MRERTSVYGFQCVKSVQKRRFLGQYFSVFGLNTERYFVYLRIQSICSKIRTRKIFVLGYFSRSVCFHILHKIFFIQKLCHRLFYKLLNDEKDSRFQRLVDSNIFFLLHPAKLSYILELTGSGRSKFLLFEARPVSQ